jgi:hypothetical protein
MTIVGDRGLGKSGFGLGRVILIYNNFIKLKYLHLNVINRLLARGCPNFNSKRL